MKIRQRREGERRRHKRGIKIGSIVIFIMRKEQEDREKKRGWRRKKIEDEEAGLTGLSGHLRERRNTRQEGGEKQDVPKKEDALANPSSSLSSLYLSPPPPNPSKTHTHTRHAQPFSLSHPSPLYACSFPLSVSRMQNRIVHLFALQEHSGGLGGLLANRNLHPANTGPICLEPQEGVGKGPNISQLLGLYVNILPFVRKKKTWTP